MKVFINQSKHQQKSMKMTQVQGIILNPKQTKVLSQEEKKERDHYISLIQYDDQDKDAIRKVGKNIKKYGIQIIDSLMLMKNEKERDNLLLSLQSLSMVPNDELTVMYRARISTLLTRVKQEIEKQKKSVPEPKRQGGKPQAMGAESNNYLGNNQSASVEGNQSQLSKNQKQEFIQRVVQRLENNGTTNNLETIKSQQLGQWLSKFASYVTALYGIVFTLFAIFENPLGDAYSKTAFWITITYIIIIVLIVAAYCFKKKIINNWTNLGRRALKSFVSKNIAELQIQQLLNKFVNQVKNQRLP